MNKNLILFNNYLIKKNNKLMNKTKSLNFELPININKNDTSGYSEKNISEYIINGLKNINKTDVILSSLKFEFENMDGDYDDIIDSIGIDENEEFFYNEEIKINKTIDYIYCYKTLDEKPYMQFLNILNNKFFIGLSDFSSSDLNFKIKFSVYIMIS